ncbi:type IV secretion system protein [Brevundimonas diminuta]|uniref:type IV secretion system protein n=1 Tax=Brevundimonas diminuta TaxID=293 RepID=UPI0030F68EB6
MASCPRLSTGDAFLSTLLRHIDCQAQAIGTGGYQALADPASPTIQVVTALLTIFVALFGLAMMMGRTPTVRDGVMAAVKIGVVLTLAMSWPAYKTVVYDVVVEGPAQLSAAVGRPAGLPGAQGDLIQRLQAADAAIIRLTNYGTGRDELATLPPANPNEPPQRTPIADNPALGWARVLFLSGAVAAFAAVRLTAGVLLALAPLFAGLLLFDVARGVFVGWMRALVFTLLASVAVTLLFGVQLALLEPWLAQVLQMRQANALTPSAPIELLVMSLGFFLALGGALAILLRLAFTLHLPTAWREAAAGRAAATAPAHADAVPLSAAAAVSTPRLGSSRAAAVAEAMSAAQRRERLIFAQGSAAAGGSPSSIAHPGGQDPAPAHAAAYGQALRRARPRKSVGAALRDRRS